MIKTEQARKLSINQLNGKVSNIIRNFRQKLLELLASIEVNMLNQSVESLKRSIVGKEVEDALIKGFTQIETKPLIELSDYLDNVGYVYRRSNGKMVIIILENAICSSGFATENKNKEAAVTPITFEATADFSSGKYDTLPVYIFYED